MGEKSAIEWTDATWNPVTGCSKVSPGCAHCYAETLSLRMGWSHQPWTPEHAGENVILHPDRLTLPLRWRKPNRIFVNSMSDLFHELVPDDFITQVFGVMAMARHHTFQILTKRPERMQEWIGNPDNQTRAFAWAGQYTTPFTAVAQWPGWPLPNVWLGTSVENQHWADIRIPILLRTRATVRFLSCEPLLSPVNIIVGYQWARGALDTPYVPPLHWVITGGESGAGARPCNPDWVRAIRDQCVANNVAFLHKQWGGRTPKAGGRLLDGQTWDEYPRVAVAV